MAKLIVGVIALALIIVIGVTSYQQVDAGNRGILLTFNAVDESKSLQEGAHFVVPFVQKVTQMEVRVLKYISEADSASKDLQTVSTEITVNYHPDPSKVQIIYKTLGTEYESRIIDPAVEEVVKQVTANYNAEELITKRPLVKQDITANITERLSGNNIIVDAISITDFQFSPEFTQAIESKVVVEQETAKAKNLVEKAKAEALVKEAKATGDKLANIQRAEGVKEAKILEAEGIAQAILIKAEAEHDRIQLLASAVKANPDFLTLEFIDQWNGKFPDTYLSSGGEELSMLLGIPNIQTP